MVRRGWAHAGIRGRRPGRSGPIASAARGRAIVGLLAAALALPTAASGAEGAAGATSHASSTGCIARATRFVDLALNLDADAAVRRPPRALGFPADAYLPNFSVPASVFDPTGRPRPILIGWIRSPAQDWIVSVGARAPISEPGAPITIPIIRPEPATSGVVTFDGRGELVGDGKLRITLPRAPAGFGADGLPAPDHPEQSIVLRLRSMRGTTTQYAGGFIQHRVAQDGVVCPQPVSEGPACWLSADLRGDGRGGEGASIFFGDGGVLIAGVRTGRERVQGFPVDLMSGKRLATTRDARIPAQLTPPRATRRIGFDLSLDAGSPLQTAAVDVFDPVATSQQQIALTIFDGVGRPRTLLLLLSREGPLDWRWTLALDRQTAALDPAWAGFDAAGEAPTSEPGLRALVITGPLKGFFSNAPVPLIALLEGGSGRLRFDGSGRLAAVSQDDTWLAPGRWPVVRIAPTLADPSDPWIELDFGAGTTRLADRFILEAIEQDGHGPGVVTGVRVSRDHVLEVVASNGFTLPVAELAFAGAGEPECRFECGNASDDDGDGHVDFPDDPDCASAFDATESPWPIPTSSPVGGH